MIRSVIDVGERGQTSRAVILGDVDVNLPEVFIPTLSACFSMLDQQASTEAFLASPGPTSQVLFLPKVSLFSSAKGTYETDHFFKGV